MKNFKRHLAGIALLGCIASTASAQVINKPALTLDGAKKVIAAAAIEAKKDSAGTGVIAVVDDGGNTIAVERLDNTFAAGANISVGKARTAALFKKPTKVFEDIIGKGRTAMVALSDFTPLQGGVPIVVDGQIVGAVGVSGAASAQRDEDIATAGANSLKSAVASVSSDAVQASQKQSPVSFFAHDEVASAFARGAILYESGDVNYAVHASYRTKSGEVEIHTKETDVIYVLDGGATFITGGKMIDGKTVSPDQIRGRDVEGGETRTITRGDVIIVPAGVPHWFKEVDASGLKYYVVKVIK